MRHIPITLIAIIVLLSSCHFGMGERVRGNGNIITQDRNISGFNKVHVSGSMNVRLMQQDQGQVKIEADENLMSYIEVYTEGSELIVRERKGFNLDPTKEIVIYAMAPSFTEISVSGSGDVKSDNSISGSEGLVMMVSGSGDIEMQVDVPSIKSRVSGSGSITLKGEAEDLDLTVSGSGAIKCFELSSENVSVSVSGSAEAEVNASRKLDISVSGSASVQYKGSPSVNSRVSGSGEVRKV